jgi:hypothetical protein
MHHTELVLHVKGVELNSLGIRKARLIQAGATHKELLLVVRSRVDISWVLHLHISVFVLVVGHGMSQRVRIPILSLRSIRSLSTICHGKHQLVRTWIATDKKTSLV